MPGLLQVYLGMEAHAIRESQLPIATLSVQQAAAVRNPQEVAAIADMRVTPSTTEPRPVTPSRVGSRRWRGPGPSSSSPFEGVAALPETSRCTCAGGPGPSGGQWAQNTGYGPSPGVRPIRSQGAQHVHQVPGCVILSCQRWGCRDWSASFGKQTANAARMPRNRSASSGFLEATALITT